jgi:hypothetical protein
MCGGPYANSNAVMWTFVWAAIMLVAFSWLAVRSYRRID